MHARTVSLLLLAAGLTSAGVAGVVEASRASHPPLAPSAAAPSGFDPHPGPTSRDPGVRPDPDAGAELLGRPAPGWTFDRWVRGGPLTLQGLRGKVVLVRWWTDGCHYCATTLPVLEGLRREHPRDLIVLGVYHPKPPRAVSDAFVLGMARELGFGGPIALDRDWRTLRRYWLDADPERGWTSVSFLIDREGVIRWVHGGGEYHPSDDPLHARCDAQYRELRAALDSALERPVAGSGPRARP